MLTRPYPGYNTKLYTLADPDSKARLKPKNVFSGLRRTCCNLDVPPCVDNLIELPRRMADTCEMQQFVFGDASNWCQPPPVGCGMPHSTQDSLKEIVVDSVAAVHRWLQRQKPVWTCIPTFEDYLGVTEVFLQHGYRHQARFGDEGRPRRNVINILVLHPYHNAYRFEHFTYTHERRNSTTPEKLLEIGADIASATTAMALATSGYHCWCQSPQAPAIPQMYHGLVASDLKDNIMKGAELPESNALPLKRPRSGCTTKKRATSTEDVSESQEPTPAKKSKPVAETNVPSSQESQATPSQPQTTQRPYKLSLSKTRKAPSVKRHPVPQSTSQVKSVTPLPSILETPTAPIVVQHELPLAQNIKQSKPKPSRIPIPSKSNSCKKCSVPKVSVATMTDITMEDVVKIYFDDSEEEDIIRARKTVAAKGLVWTQPSKPAPPSRSSSSGSDMSLPSLVNTDSNSSSTIIYSLTEKKQTPPSTSSDTPKHTNTKKKPSPVSGSIQQRPATTESTSASSTSSDSLPIICRLQRKTSQKIERAVNSETVKCLPKATSTPKTVHTRKAKIVRVPKLFRKSPEGQLVEVTREGTPVNKQASTSPSPTEPTSKPSHKYVGKQVVSRKTGKILHQSGREIPTFDLAFDSDDDAALCDLTIPPPSTSRPIGHHNKDHDTAQVVDSADELSIIPESPQKSPSTTEQKTASPNSISISTSVDTTKTISYHGPMTATFSSSKTPQPSKEWDSRADKSPLLFPPSPVLLGESPDTSDTNRTLITLLSGPFSDDSSVSNKSKKN